MTIRERARAALERAKAATPGPWIREMVQDGEILPDGTGYAGDWYEGRTVIVPPGPDERDCDAVDVADFIDPNAAVLACAYRTAAPLLAGECERLMAEAERLRREADEARESMEYAYQGKQRAREKTERAEEAARRLADAIGDAPHTSSCGYTIGRACDCWKSRALVPAGAERSET